MPAKKVKNSDSANSSAPAMVPAISTSAPVESLTIKREAFAQEYIINGGNASEAYRKSHDVKSDTKPETIWRSAYGLLNSPKVAARIADLQAGIAIRHNVSVDSLMAELEEVRAIALAADPQQLNVAINATMSKAKLMGVDKQPSAANLVIMWGNAHD